MAALLGLGVAFTVVGHPAEASAANRVHKVARGHTLDAIARRYGVTVDAICKANRISPKKMLKPGDELVIPGVEAKPEKRGKRRVTAGDRRGVRWHRVAKGQLLGSIARRYNVSVEAICHANGIGRRSVIKPGQKLIIPARSDEDGSIARAVREEKDGGGPAEEAPKAKPEKGDAEDGGREHRTSKKRVAKKGAKKSDDADDGRPSWKRYARPAKKRGLITLRRLDGETWHGYVIGKGERVLPAAKQAFRRMLGTKKGAEKDIDPRLIRLISKVSDTFGGRTIRIVSGFRNGRTTGQSSRHRHGRAMDFTVDGVPNEALRDFCKTFDDVGVGYYPNSHFVHLDVRKRWTYWIDFAGPGQPARYGGFWTKKGRVR